MGDIRFREPYRRLVQSEDRAAQMTDLSDDEVVQALAHAAQERDLLLSNVLATEAMNRMRRSRIMTQHLAEGVIVVDASGRGLDANPAAERLLGWHADELRGEDVSARVRFEPLEDHQDAGACPFETPLVEGGAVEGEGCFRRADGGRLPVAFVAAPIQHDGEVEGAVVSFREIAQRVEERRRDEVMRDVRDLFATSLGHEDTLRQLARVVVPRVADWAAVYAMRPDGSLFRLAIEHRDADRAAPTIAALVSRPPTLPPGSPLAPVVQRGEPLLFARVDDVTLATMAQDRAELLRRLGTRSLIAVPLAARGRVAGAILLARGEGSPAFGESDLRFAMQLAERAGIAVDNARLREQLLESHARYEAVATGAGDGIWELDVRTHEVYRSPRWSEALGYAPDEAPVGLDGWLALLHPDDRDRAERALDDVLAGRVDDYRLEHRLRHQDGSYRWMLGRGVLLRDAEGRPTRFVGSNVDITDRKRAEEALAESKERYKALFDNAPYGVLTLDAEGHITAANDHGLRAAGLAREEVVGEHFTRFVAEEDHERLLELYAAVLMGEPQTVRFELLHGSGRRLKAEAAAIPVIVRGEVVGVHAVWEDVTERTEWEERLARSEEQYRLLVENITDYGIYMLDPEGRILSWGVGAARISGYDAEEVLGQHFRIFYPPERRERGDPERELQIAVGEGRYEEEGWRVRRDGTRFWAHATISPVRGPDGRLHGFSKLVQDVTAAHHAQLQLRRRERQQAVVASLGAAALAGADLQELFDRAVSDLRDALDVEMTKVLRLDADGRRLTLVAGRGWNDDVTPGRETVSTGPDSQAGYTLLTGGPVVTDDLREETRFSGPSLLLRHGVVSGMSVVIQGRRRPWGVLGAHTRVRRSFTEEDVNVLQSVANVLTSAIHRRETEAELERRVVERTAELAEAVRDLETFADSLSHDLRAPLRGANAMLAFLQEEHASELSEDARELLGRAVGENRRAMGLVQDLLAFSRSGKEPIRLDRVDLSRLATDAAKEVTATHPEWRTRWSVEPGLSVRADPGLMRIVLRNLLHNAAKYSAGREEPHVEVGQLTREGRRWVYVRDNGVGFAPEEAQRLFRPFSRLSSAVGVEGTGLGLVTVHRIVTRHGGELRAESRPGEGATFLFTLPEA